MKLYQLIILGLLFSCGEKKVADPEANKTLIKNVLNSQTEAWNKGDITGFMSGYWPSDSLKFIVKGKVRKGYNLVLASYKTHYPDQQTMGKLSFTDVEIDAMDDDFNIYNVTGNWKVEARDTSSGNFSLIFKNIKGKWLIVADHTF